MKKLNQEYKRQLIANEPFFQNLPNHIIESLTDIMQEVHFNVNDVIVKKNDFATDFYLIMDGKAKVIADEFDNHSAPVAILGVGESIGLSAHGFYSTTGKHSATVIAMTELNALHLNIASLDAIIKQMPNADKILSDMSLWLMKLDFIKKLGPFSELTNDNVYHIARCITELAVPANTDIVKFGEQADCCYLILDGKVEVIAPQSDGAEKQLAILETNSLFGEAGILTTGRRNSTVRSMQQTKLLVLHRTDLINLLKTEEAFTHSLVGFMVNRFQPTPNPNVKVHESIGSDQTKIISLEQTQKGYFYRLNNESQFIWENLNGVNTIQELTLLFLDKFKIFSPDSICNLLYDLAQRDFVVIPVINLEALRDSDLSSWQRFKRKLYQVMEKEITLVGMDDYFTKKYQNGCYLLFKWPVQLLLILTICYGIGTFIQLYTRMTTAHYSFHDELTNVWLFIILIIPINLMTTILHEFAHAITTKHYSYHVHRLGMVWHWISPVVFADTSEIWRANRKQKLIVDIAGIYSDLFVASVFILFAYICQDKAIFGLLWLISIFTYFQAFKNMSPIREYDGCFVLMDLLGKSALRADAYNWLIQLSKGKASLKDASAEFIYWIACLVYLVALMSFTYIVIVSFLTILEINSFMGLNEYQVAFSISIFMLIMGVLNIIFELNRTKKAIEYQNHEKNT